jgi:hypothetical protein
MCKSCERDDQKKEDKKIYWRKIENYTSSWDEFQHPKAFHFHKVRFFSSIPQE